MEGCPRGRKLGEEAESTWKRCELILSHFRQYLELSREVLEALRSGEWERAWLRTRAREEVRGWLVSTECNHGNLADHIKKLVKLGLVDRASRFFEEINSLMERIREVDGECQEIVRAGMEACRASMQRVRGIKKLLHAYVRQEASPYPRFLDMRR